MLVTTRQGLDRELDKERPVAAVEQRGAHDVVLPEGTQSHGLVVEIDSQRLQMRILK